MKLARFGWLPVALLAAVGAAPASAQNIPGSVELTGIGGGYFGAQIFENASTEVHASTTFEYGARLGYNLTEGIGLEAAWTHAEPDLEATAVGEDGINGVIGTLKSDAYEVDGLFSLGNDFASFYMVVSIGATTLSPSIPGLEARTSTDLSTSFGIGGKLWLGRHFGLRAEGRFRWVFTGHTTGAGIWCDPYDVCYGFSTSVYGYPDAVGGVTVRF